MIEDGKTNDFELEQSFGRILIGDVVAARARLAHADSAQHRREAVRATFAAIEGVTWLYREHVRGVAQDMHVLTPLADLALRERTFTISEQGAIIEQVRFVTLPTIIKLTTRQAQLIDPAVSIDTQAPGWSSLKTGIAIRNRVTHPKCRQDLEVSDADIAAITAGLFWLLASTETVLTAITATFRSYVAQTREIADALGRGDPDVLEEYRRAMMEGGDT